jgi:urease accessory protein
MHALLLLLADGRFPSGGYAHSGGLEEAVKAGRVRDVHELEAFLVGRVGTIGRTEAVLSAAAWFAAPSAMQLGQVDRELVARCPSLALRTASRTQARGLLRAARGLNTGVQFGSETDGSPRQLPPTGLMLATTLGAVAKYLGLGPEQCALTSLYGCVSGPAWAAARLLGLDPLAVARCLARLCEGLDDSAGSAVLEAGGQDLASLPAYGAPLLEVGAEAHASWEVRLFAS